MQTADHAFKVPWHRHAAIPLICLLGGWTFTGLLYLWSAYGEHERGKTEFAQYSEKFRTDLSARVNSYIDTLPGLKALADLENDPDELRFSQFVSAISLQKRFPGLAFFFTADRVSRANLENYVSSVRNDRSLRTLGRPDFTISPSGDRPEYMIVRHSFPETNNTLGYDLFDPAKSYRLEVDRAISSGLPVATSPIVLARNRDDKFAPDTASFVVRLAVYEGGMVPKTIEQRRQAIHGIVGVALQTRYLIETTLDSEINKRLKLRIVDRTEDRTESLVFDDVWLKQTMRAPSEEAQIIKLPLDVANRRWIIEATDRVSPVSYWLGSIPLMILICGLLISTLLSLLMRSLVRTTLQAEGVAANAMVQLKREQQALEEAQALASVGSWDWDIDTDNLYCSAQLCRLYGITVEDWRKDQQQLFLRVPEEERALLQKSLRSTVKDHIPFDIEHRIRNADGDMIFVHARAHIQRDETGRVHGLAGTVQDITARKRTEAAVAAHELRYRFLFENSMDGVMQTTPEGHIIAANPAACILFGCTVSQLTAMTRRQLIDPTDGRLANLLAQRGAHGKATGELRMKRANGELFDAELSSSVYSDSNGRVLTSMVIRDITERKRSELEIARLAFSDGLTGLPNRRLLVDRIVLALANAKRHKKNGAVLFLDLDNFKTVNDARGHATGDALLCQVADRLKSLIREGDTVARLGGDEFVILLSNLADTPEAAAIEALTAAERINMTLSAGYTINGLQYMSTCSIGISIFLGDGQNCDDVLREADTAMYRAKSEGKHRIALFAQSMQAKVEEQLSLAHALEHAIRDGEMHMVAQAQYDSACNECGCELLLRWTHKTLGLVSPEKFIPVAEETGLILRIGDWVIDQGCRAVARLQAIGIHHTVSVNVSPRQFHQPDFIARVGAMLTTHAVRPGQLILEVTEGLLIGNVEETAIRMRELNKLGILFSIDDFGTGYSSLAYLKKLPLHELKIDKTFVRDMPTDLNDTAIVQLILGMAKHLHLRVVAEGVETNEQRDFLIERGCDSLQGFLLARPVRVETWLENHTSKSLNQSTNTV